LEPSTVVEFSIVLDDEAIAANNHVVNTSNWESHGVCKESPSPSDAVAVVPDVEGRDRNLWLLLALANVESGLVGESNRAKLRRISKSTYRSSWVHLQGSQP